MMWHNFNWIDYIIIGIIAVSTIISLFRGFVREVISLTAWVVGFGVALHYAPLFQNYLREWVASEPLRHGVAFVIIFLLVLLFGMLINLIVGFWVDKAGLSVGNRLLGIVFGAARGLAVVMLLLMLVMSMNNFSENPALTQSVLVPKLTPVLEKIKNFFPSQEIKTTYF